MLPKAQSISVKQDLYGNKSNCCVFWRDLFNSCWFYCANKSIVKKQCDGGKKYISLLQYQTTQNTTTRQVNDCSVYTQSPALLMHYPHNTHSKQSWLQEILVWTCIVHRHTWFSFLPHQWAELLHSLQYELLVSNLLDSQLFQVLRGQLEQIQTRQMPLRDWVLMQRGIQTWPQDTNVSTLCTSQVWTESSCTVVRHACTGRHMQSDHRLTEAEDQ